ncbi:MAG: hypothetical protein QOG55_2508 [Acidobacteriaceae bacterium]|jgi:hypothetical protein|nr:hypothetical protein [Acidobacteriaceae bacterium]
MMKTRGMNSLEECKIIRPSFAVLHRGYCTSGQADRFFREKLEVLDCRTPAT